MALTNYRDLCVGGDLNAGFQFEFACEECGAKWKSPFKPYRLGQLTGFLTRFAFMLSSNFRNASRTTGTMADFGSRGAKEAAFKEAMEHAETLYVTCPRCKHGVCHDCYDNREELCTGCLQKQKNANLNAAREASEAALNRSAHACPNCSTPNPGGGRFCAECGFDMASTHKSCPACNAMLTRQARFCTDCGHGF